MELLEVLSEIQYPANKVQIIIHADKRGVDQEGLNLLSAVPNQSYSNVHEIKNALNFAKYKES
jgi:hypothetical protein